MMKQKRAHDSQTVLAKENHTVPSQRQASDTNQRTKALHQDRQ